MVEAVRVSVGGHALAVRRAGVGGVPLVLLHGFPAGGAMFERNLAELAQAGFDVAAPDLRGFGDSDFAPDGFYDVAAFSGDVAALCDAFGWRRAVLSGYGLGAVVAVDFAGRFPGRTDRLVLLNHVPPTVNGDEAAALPAYVEEQGRETDDLVRRLEGAAGRRDYVAGFLREWGAAGAFADADIAAFTAPYADAARMEAAFGYAQALCGTRESSGPAMLDRQVRQPVLVLTGPDDGALADNFIARCEAAYPQVIGPFVVPGAGRFLMWEKPRLYNRTLAFFCADLID
ncbi:alpha/beta fold hydrolase [Phytomonospora endophytica]|uniref:Pimeloyl-ACP methyl ester carboxylesterase n=1 Tax=Phytomonospora endophytica TaxID=714109 RepID=A0A841G1Y3_9ACTN|nr:alpha/beta hydrolase [Phytomonospora endophytica]MBB6038699.1 pimeloyl-ACP methyl ester carboxylesterase [Phytomonospora endophytica]GIG68504.1 alpha/beta hydrolase [Phytomonospora endophytica]